MEEFLIRMPKVVPFEKQAIPIISLISAIPRLQRKIRVGKSTEVLQSVFTVTI
jgi:hypothetical protein